MIRVNVKDATSLLQAIQKSISDQELATWMKTKADPYMRGVFTEQFQSEGSRLGTPWLGILESSLEKRGQKKYRKSKLGTGRLGGAKIFEGRVKGVNILQDTGELFNKVTKKPGLIEKYYSGLKITWGKDLGSWNKVDKYTIHQTGAGNNPPRKMIGATDRDAKHLMLSLWGYIGGKIRAYRR